MEGEGEEAGPVDRRGARFPPRRPEVGGFGESRGSAGAPGRLRENLREDPSDRSWPQGEGSSSPGAA